ncbi:MAG: FRG domain-containing protein [Proteobacteria bacterium]|nr:MAG: FRG domain-containing protein [Pseudomonadota bacterium]
MANQQNNEIPISENPVTSLTEFLSRVIEFTNGLEKDQQVWFRGHSSTDYKLIPNLYRQIIEDQPFRPANVLRPRQINMVERGIDASFSRQAHGFLASSNMANTPMNRYFLKQHYKINTRLLDWTESALTALYFAVKDQSNNTSDAKVYLLLPFLLNNHTIQTLKKDSSRKAYMIFSGSEDFSKEGPLFNSKDELRMNQLLYKYYILDIQDGESLYPIAIYPPYLDQRMAAQKSCFTMFGNIIDGLKAGTNTEQFLFSIQIEKESKGKILSELRTIGYTEFSVYPDLDGLGQSINTEYDYRVTQERLAESMEMLANYFQSLGEEPTEEKDIED